MPLPASPVIPTTTTQPADSAYMPGQEPVHRHVRGGGAGLMGALADGALSHGGRVIGVLPRCMKELEWGHPRLTELRLVEDMRTRKHLLSADTCAVVALPGGCGTLEKLMEMLTLKRLDLYTRPIVMVNTRRFFDPLIDLLSLAIQEKFMDERHRAMWQLIEEPEQVVTAIETAMPWSPEAREFAVL